VKININESLQAYINEALYRARPRRNGTVGAPNAVLADILAKAEAVGDAMRYLDQRGRIAWKATPRLREYIADLKADAEADAEKEAM